MGFLKVQGARPRGDFRGDGAVASAARAGRRSQDPALRLSGRVEVGRSLSDQRKLQPQRQRLSLRRPRSLSARHDDRALPRDELGGPRSAALALPSAQRGQVPRRPGFHRGRRRLLRPTGPSAPARISRASFPADADIVKVDDYTVDFMLKTPAPLLINQWAAWGIFSKSWSEAHGATEATAMNATTPPYAGLHANGTGPFILVSHEPGVKTVWKKNPNWWDKPTGNVDEVVFTPISNPATRVAALLSGEIDWMDPVPLNDQARVNANPTTEVMAGPEDAHDLSGHGPVARRARPLQRQGQEPVQGRPRPQGLLSGDRRGRDRQEGDARPGDLDGADDRAVALRAI